MTRRRFLQLVTIAGAAHLSSGAPALAAERPRPDGALHAVAAAGELGGPEAAALAARSRGLRLVEREGAVGLPVVLEAAGGSGARIDQVRLRELGCEVDAVSRSYVRVLAPLVGLGRALAALAAHPDVARVRAPLRPKPLATGLGDFVSESVELTGAAAVQEQGITGAGVEVAVVDVGFIGLLEAVSAGELPADTVMVDLPGLSDNPIEADYKHGVGVAEQVADMAPGSRIHCIKVDDEVDLENAADYMSRNGIRVGVHSVGWVNGSYYDGTGPVSDVFNDSHVLDDVFWAVAAGNEAKNHWRGTWSDPDSDGVLNFTDTDQRMQISASTEVDAFVNWDQYGDALTDLDLYVYDRSGTLVGLSEDSQAATGDPSEGVSFDYDYTRAPYGIEVVHFSGPTGPPGIPAPLDVTVFCFDNELEHAVAENSLMDPAPADGVCAVAAINRAVWNKANPSQEPFSSQGPTTDGRTKPDISAPDGTTSSSYGVMDSYGTSFSAPVVAGAAALLLESDPTLTADEIHDALLGAADDVGDPGLDDIFGAGKLSLVNLGPLRTVHFVDASAPGPVHDGTSWEAAFLHPQDALDVAQLDEDVWVAAGTYQRRAPTDEAVLSMATGVALYGGFAGGETKRGERDAGANPTVLDGGGVCTHVAVAASGSRLDGFTLTGGDAAGAGEDGRGGGLLASGVSDATVSGCVISSNTAGAGGGGLAALGATGLKVEDCEFTDNSVAAGDGGGALVQASSASLERSSFAGNQASTAGGAVSVEASGPLVRDCTFDSNVAQAGGAVNNGAGASTDVVSCLFTANRADTGGAVFNADDSKAALRNCTLVGNAAAVEGGAVLNDALSHTLVTNCCLWGNRPEQLFDRCPASKVSYSVVEGGLEGLGVVRVLDADPEFVEPGHWDDGGTPGEESDDVWVSPEACDYRLQPGSPCIDAAHGDEAPAEDIEGTERSNDRGTPDTGIGDPTYVDIGAYEFQGRSGTGKKGGWCALGGRAGPGGVLAVIIALLSVRATIRRRPRARAARR